MTTVDASEAEAALGQKLERVIAYKPDGTTIDVTREQIQALDLGGLAVAFKSDDGKIHRVIGLPIEAIFVESRILQPV